MFSTVLTSPLRNMKYVPTPHSLELHRTLPPAAPAPTLPESCVPNVYYLDDPTDGASTYLLTQMGLSLSRGGDITALRRAMPQVGLWLTAVHQEHSFPFPVRYSADEGGVAVDVRDPGGAWVRVVLHEGDVLEVAAGAWHRAQRAPLALAEVAPSPLFAGGDAGALTSGTALAPHFSGRVQLPSRAGLLLMAAQAEAGGAALAPREAVAAAALRFPPGAPADPVAAAPFFSQPGYPHTRAIVAELCNSFYYLGWVTGTGGSISIRTGGRIFMAPSAVQKERMQPQDMFVLDGAGSVLYAPAPLPGKVRLRVSQCAPLFQSAFALRGAGACIHTHSLHAVAATLPRAGEAPPREFRITHQEMIKGIAGHGYTDTLVVPILENTPHEADLAESMAEAMRAYPRSNAVLVRRHGVYIWGETWEAAKTQAECYHYLFEAAGAMRALGLDPGAVPTGAATGVGASRAYGSGKERDSSYAGLAAGGGVAAAPTPSGGLATPKRSEALGEGWHGAAGTSSSSVGSGAGQHEHAGGCCGGGGGEAAGAAFASPQPLPARGSFSHVVLDVEGCTTSLAFVAETLFPYAASRLPGWLAEQWGSASGPAGEDVAALCALSAADVAAGVEGAAEHALDGGAVLGAWRAGSSGGSGGSSSSSGGMSSAEAQAAVVRNVAWQMRCGRKSGALKALQGHIWREGYESGALQGHLFGDTPVALRAWAAGGVRTYIYSSGSREAQVLLFTHSVAGDVTGLLSGYFDTSVGVKVESASYSDICATLGCGRSGAARVLFATDALPEAVAARAAGMQAVLTVRPGNNPLPEAAKEFPWVQSLAELA